MTSINFKIITCICIFLSSCTSQTLKNYSDNSNSTQIKSNDFKNEVNLKNKIDKQKLKSLNVSNNLIEVLFLN